MGLIVVNLANIFKQQFGIDVVHPKVTGNQANNPVTGITIKNIYGDAPIQKTSLLGTPIYESTSVATLDGSLPELVMPDSMLIDVNQPTEVVKTAIARRNGKVKEYIALDDYQIRLHGLVVNFQSIAYPQQAVKALRQMFQKGAALSITNDILNDVFGIHNVVVVSRDFPRLEATPNVQPFTIDLLSDDPIELTLKLNNLVN